MNVKGSQIDGMLIGFQFYFILFMCCLFNLRKVDIQYNTCWW